jgi:hypothetical protein
MQFVTAESKFNGISGVDTVLGPSAPLISAPREKMFRACPTGLCVLLGILLLMQEFAVCRAL